VRPETTMTPWLAGGADGDDAEHDSGDETRPAEHAAKPDGGGGSASALASAIR
jgi:hypothetical protein